MSTNSPTPFELLNLPVSFDVDQKLLHKRMIELAAANHPDRFDDPLDQADAAEQSAAINQAYRQLKSPQSQAQLLLDILGQGTSRDEKALPPNLLMEMMEIREEMEEAIDSDDQTTLDRLRTWAQEQQATYLESLTTQLSQAQVGEGQPKPEIIQTAQISLNCLRYMDRMLEQMPASDGD